MAPCPVCNEPLQRETSRCFRCESDLTPWWRFERTLSVAEIASPTRVVNDQSGGRSQQALWLSSLLGAAFLGLLLGMSVNPNSTKQRNASASMQPAIATAPQPPPDPRSAPSPTEDSANESTIKLVVQEGDSLWRLAKTLTGRGDSWQQLWPDTSEAQARSLVAGTQLTVRLPWRTTGQH